MAVDLHLHSVFSDGSSTPAEIVEAAAAASLTTIALTDHDNLDGIASTRDLATSAGIDFIPGTELSVEWRGVGMHLLVYFLEPREGPLQSQLARIQQGRADRNRTIVDRLNELEIEITYEQVAREAGGHGIGRPHFAAVLVRMGHADDIRDAFDKYLATGRAAYMPRTRLKAETAIELARHSGAVPVVAHPHTLGLAESDYREAFEGLAATGLGGLEAHYSGYSPALRLHLAKLCASLNMAATGGSDYHGTYKPDISIGTGRGDLNVPDTCVTALHEQRFR